MALFSNKVHTHKHSCLYMQVDYLILTVKVVYQVRIWDYFNNLKHTLLEDSTKTLEESNLQMNQCVSTPEIKAMKCISNLHITFSMIDWLFFFLKHNTHFLCVLNFLLHCSLKLNMERWAERGRKMCKIFSLGYVHEFVKSIEVERIFFESFSLKWDAWELFTYLLKKFSACFFFWYSLFCFANAQERAHKRMSSTFFISFPSFSPLQLKAL